MNELTPERVRVYWASKTFNDLPGLTPSSEPWYGTKFGLQDVPKEWLEQWTSGSQVTSSYQVDNCRVAYQFSFHCCLCLCLCFFP